MKSYLTAGWSISRESTNFIYGGKWGSRFKTTFSASLAARAAIDGLRVFVLTIDPSQRLKTTLNLNESGETSRLAHAEFRGSIDACILNSKKTFDDFITEATGRPGDVEKILKNHLYQQLSTHLAGSQEFTSLERIFQAKRSNQYDLIIVDTPPTEHALDFLESPQKLLRLFRGSVMKWFQKKESPGLLGGIFQFGTKKVLSSLEFLTGLAIYERVIRFFYSVANLATPTGKKDDRVPKFAHGFCHEFSVGFQHWMKKKFPKSSISMMNF